MGCGGEEVLPRDRSFCMRLFGRSGNFSRDLTINYGEYGAASPHSAFVLLVLLANDVNF